MYPRFTPEEWAQHNPYAYNRGVSPPRNRHEEPRRGYRSDDYRSVSPPYSTELRRRPRVTPTADRVCMLAWVIRIHSANPDGV